MSRVSGVCARPGAILSRALRVSLALISLATAAGLVPALATAGPLDSMPVGTWYEVPSSKLASVDPCPSNNCSYTGIEGQDAVVDDWNGGAFASGYGAQGGFVVFGGGHRGYYGNEVYVFDVAQLKWVRLTEPVQNPVCDYNEGELQDGSPCSAHTYDYVDYHPGTNSFVELGSTSNMDQGGGGSPRVHLLNLGTKQWRRGARRANFYDQTGASSAYDPNRDAFWFLGAYNNYFSSYNPNANSGAGAWTLHQQFNIEIDGVAAIDPTRDLYVVVEGRVTHQIYVFDLKQPSTPPVVIKTSGDTTIQNSAGNGFDWDPVAKAFVGWDGGTSVYTLRAPSGDWRTGTWTWTRIDASSGNTVSPGAANDRNTYSRWRYVPAVNAWVVVNGVNSDVFFYKLTNGTTSTTSTTSTASSVTLTASPQSVASQGTSTLTWSSQNASQCTASGAWSGTKATSGSQTVGPLTASSSFTLICANSAGDTATAITTVTVTSPPTLGLSASPTSVASGSGATLSWTSTNATSCSASGGWGGSQPLSGTAQTGALSQSTDFILDCAGPGGTVRQTATVTVTASDPAPTLTFAASPTSVQSGGSGTLTWSSTNASACTASGAWSGTKAVSGSQSFGPLTASATYTLSCTGSGGTVQKSALVTVLADSSSTSTATSASGGAGITGIRVASQSSSAQTQVPVTFGEVFRPGDVPAGATLSASLSDGTNIPLQVDKKTANADGSLRNAVLSMRVPNLPASSSVQVQLGTGGTAPAGSVVQLSELLATSFDAQVTLTLSGTAYSASARSLLQAGTNVKQWLSGPVVSEWIVGAPVRTSGSTAHPHLTAYFHVRAYRGAAGGVDRVRVDTVVENGWTLVPGPATFDYTADIKVGGQSVYSGGISHYHHTRWHRQAWWPSAPQRVVQHDTTYLQNVRVVPGYADVKPTDSFLSSLMQDATPMGHGDLTQHFPDTGAQDQIGPLPKWAANYITSGADVRAYRNLLANDDSAGSYSVHYRDETTGQPVSIADHPTLSLQTNELPTVSGSNPNTEDNAHQPSIGFLSYLLTGDYFYLEEMQFWTSWNELWMNPDYRQGGKGIFTSQVRSQAWSLRNLGQSAYATPDGDHLKAPFVASVGYNIANYETLYSSNPTANNLGAVASYDGYAKFSAWQDDFLTWTLSYLVDLGFDARAMRDWKFKFPIGRMGTTDYCYVKAAIYSIHSGTSDTDWYPDFATLYSANFGTNTSCPEGAAMDGYPDSPTGYPSNLRPALVAAVEANATGSTDAWRRFTTSSVQPDYTNMPVWALVPRASTSSSTSTTTTPTTTTPSLTFTASASSVVSGSTVTLNWSSAGLSSCTASGGWSGTKSVSGSENVGPLSANTTFTLACQGTSGSVSKSVSVSVTAAPAPSPAPTVTLSASPTSVSYGGGSTLQWSSTNATSCMASDGWTGTKATSGTQTLSNLTQTASYTLACTGAGGSAQASTTITVSSSSTTTTPGSGPSLSFSAQPTSVVSGGSTTLSWSSTNVRYCYASGGWSGRKRRSGSETLTNLTQTNTYTLTCKGRSGTVQKSVQVTVTSSTPTPTPTPTPEPTPMPAPTLSLTATPTSVESGQSSVLTWASTDATSCTASGGWSGTKLTSGSETVGPLSNATSYTLACTGAGGSVQRTVTVGIGTSSQTGALSGLVDSSLVDSLGQNRVYVFAGTVTPDDADGDSGDPTVIIPVKQEDNSCGFSYSLASLPAGTYTLAFTREGAKDTPGVNDQITFVGTRTVTIGLTPVTAIFNAARILRVGPGQQYATIRDAAAAATEGTVIEVDVGDYPDDIVVWRTNNVVVRGVGTGRPHVYGTQIIPYISGDDLRNGKGLWVVRGSGMRIENFEMSGARVTDENGAPVRNEGRNLTICNGYFHDNENGFLGEAYGTLIIEYSIFDNNGIGDGHTHNVYVGDGGTTDETLIFRHNDSSHAKIGHLLKTRARVNYVLYNRLMDEANGTSSYNIDVPNGGLTYVIGNVMQQGPNTDNSAMVAYGAEGLLSGRSHSLYLVNNTLVNDRGSGQFVTSATGLATFRSVNNLFVGAGTLYSGAQPQSVTNLQTSSPGFLDSSAYDYRLTSQSPARNIGSDPGIANGVNLTPVWQYVDPAGREARIANGAIDVGAYEYTP